VTLRDRDGCTDGEDEVMEAVLERRGGGGLPERRDSLVRVVYAPALSTIMKQE
jgi:hypothetical protein